MGRYREAEEFALPAYATLLSALGPERRHLQDAADAVLSLYQKWNQPKKLKAFRAQLEADGVSPRPL